MDARPLGTTGLEVGPIAYGCWRFAGTTVADAHAKVEAALDRGLTLIDTADIYGVDSAAGFGGAETLLGEVLAVAPGLRERMVLATKGGIVPGVPYDSSPTHLRDACEASLRRLRTETVDLYQVHRPDLLTHPEDVAETLVDLREAGKVREIGVSNHTPSQVAALRAALDDVPIVTNQPELSLLHLDPIDDGSLDDAMVHGTIPLAWSPLAGGRLAGGDVPAPLGAVLDDLAGREGVSATTIALAWVMAHPSRPVPIVGTQRLERIDEASRAAEVTLTRSDWYSLAEAAGAAAAVTVEVSWFAALCDDDYELLGVPDPALLSSSSHCGDIVRTAEAMGFDNVLLPSGYALGIDAVAFAAAVAPTLERIRLLVAVRCGELWPPQLARQLATLDHLLDGRLTVNIISSDRPGETLDSGTRYQRTREEMAILRSLLDRRPVSHHGPTLDLEVEPPRIGTVSGRCPPFYFGGMSEQAREVAAEAADVYLMWPDTEPAVEALVADMRARAARHGRELRFGYRVHVVVRETEAEARAAAAHLVSALDDAVGDRIRERSLDSASAGVRRQAELRDAAGDEGYVEDCLWTGIGRARSGCGAAIVGDPDQVRAKLERYVSLGIDAFILSGYPHRDECERFGRLVLPHLDHGPPPT